MLSLSKEPLTLLMWKRSQQDETETYVITPRKLLSLLVGSYLLLIIVLLLFFYVTPLGTLLFNHEDRAMRQQIVEIYAQVEGLRDSLEASEFQLFEFKRVLEESSDTTFSVGPDPEMLAGSTAGADRNGAAGNLSGTRPDTPRGLLSNEIIFSSRFYLDAMAEFPKRFPLAGSVTRRFEASTGHYGIDIAAEDGTRVRALSSGVVLFSAHTINYGSVLVIQHADAYVSVYKHCKSLTKRKGDYVSQGDILGKVSDTGLISSGPHLHFELWRQGMPLNPEDYFNNLN